MSAVADRLADLRSTDAAPSLEELGGAVGFAAQLSSLPVELLPAAVRVLRDQDLVEPALLEAFIGRLVDMDGPLSFDEAAETLIRHAKAVHAPELAIALLDELLKVFDARDRSDEDAVRAGHAIQAAVDLVRTSAGATDNALLARLERLDAVPELTARPLARAVGRISEDDDSDFLIRLLEQEIMVHETASAQATLELGLVALRAAFEAEDPAVAAEALDKAINRFATAGDLEEGRADARAFAAAAKTVRALPADEGTFNAELDALAAAKREYDIYDPREERTDRVVGPIHSLAAWDVLASRLRSLRSGIDEPDVLHLRPALQIMAEAYAGVALDTVADEPTGLRAFVRPAVASALARDPRLAMGAEAYEGLGQLPTALKRGEENPKA